MKINRSLLLVSLGLVFTLFVGACSNGKNDKAKNESQFDIYVSDFEVDKNSEFNLKSIDGIDVFKDTVQAKSSSVTHLNLKLKDGSSVEPNVTDECLTHFNGRLKTLGVTDSGKYLGIYFELTKREVLENKPTNYVGRWKDCPNVTLFVSDYDVEQNIRDINNNVQKKTEQKKNNQIKKEEDLLNLVNDLNSK